jgi:hypothetical protein
MAKVSGRRRFDDGARELAMWRRLFEEARQRSAANPKVGLMKLQPVPGEHRYAVAVREGADLWLRMWVRRSRKGEFFIMRPLGDGTGRPPPRRKDRGDQKLRRQRPGRISGRGVGLFSNSLTPLPQEGEGAGTR